MTMSKKIEKQNYTDEFKEEVIRYSVLIFAK